MKKYYNIVKILLTLTLIANCGNLAAQDDNEATKTLSPYFVVLSDNPDVDMLPFRILLAAVTK